MDHLIRELGKPTLIEGTGWTFQSELGKPTVSYRRHWMGHPTRARKASISHLC